MLRNRTTDVGYSLSVKRTQEKIKLNRPKPVLYQIFLVLIFLLDQSQSIIFEDRVRLSNFFLAKNLEKKPKQKKNKIKN